MRAWQPTKVNESVAASPALSMASRPGETLRTRQVAILVADGSDGNAITRIQDALTAQGAVGKIVGERLGEIATSTGKVAATMSVATTSSVLFDAVFVAGGEKAAAALSAEPLALDFVCEAFAHYKTVAASGAGEQVLEAAGIIGAKPHPKAGPNANPQAGVVRGSDKDIAAVAKQFLVALGAGRHWTRGLKPPVPA